MKLVLPIAQVVAVTNLMLKHGSGEEATLVPGKCLTFRAEVNPEFLDELREQLSDKFFEAASGKGPRVPCIPELDGAIGWKTEYEGGTLKLDLRELEDLDFEDEELVLGGVNAKDLTFEPLSTGMVAIKVNAVMETAGAEERGKLDALQRHTVKATFSKLTQKPLAEPKKASDDAAKAPDNQGQLPIDGAPPASEGDAPPTTDGKPITPLMH